MSSLSEHLKDGDLGREENRTKIRGIKAPPLIYCSDRRRQRAGKRKTYAWPSTLDTKFSENSYALAVSSAARRSDRRVSLNGERGVTRGVEATYTRENKSAQALELRQTKRE